MAEHATEPRRPTQPEAEAPDRSGCVWGVRAAAGCLLLLLIPIVVVVVSSGVTLNGIVGGIRDILSGDQPRSATVVSTQTIVQGIQPLGQLVSISSQLAKADIYVGIQQGALNACSYSANHVAQGTIEAGIDLTRITEQNVTYDALSNTYTLVLLPPELTSCRVDYIRQYDRSFTACAIDWDEARLLANYESLVEFRDDALEGGILNRAQQEARLVLGNFVQLVTGSNVQINFSEPAQIVVPPSCQPSLPQGWTYDPGSRTWFRP